jgi:predicted AlkP superfamily phosphohydrolase/phosphomutase
MNTPRTLIIGLDGATFDLLKPWAQAGYLPTLGRLMSQGAHGPLLAWPNMNSAAAWTSMVTGCNPGQHGVFDFGTAAPQRGTTWQPTTARSRAKSPFWHLLSAAGRSVGIVNIPITYPADPVNGFMLAGMDAPSVNSPGFAHPPGLPEELRQAGISYILDAPKLGGSGKRKPHRTPDSVRRMVEGRAGAILHLMKTQAWDTLMAVFIATDRIQHFYWPSEDVSFDSAVWKPVRSVYEQIDSFLDEALRLADENTTVLLVSDHGFGPAYYATRSVNQLLGQIGLLCYHQSGNRLSSRLFRNLLLYGRKIIPLSLQPHLARAFPKFHLRSLSENAYWGIDWSNTQAYVHPYGGQVHINLKGREVEGTVSPEQYDSVRERIRDILMSLTDAANGKHVIRAVGRREDLYHGPYSQKAADLNIRWDYEIVRNSLCYQAEGESVIVQAQKRSGSARQWWGTHRPDGIFIAHGSHIKRGATVSNATLYDIAPTILYLQHHPVPDDMDGKVLTDIFTEEQLRRQPVQHCASTCVMDKTAPADLDAKESEKIKNRLKDLGYLE